MNISNEIKRVYVTPELSCTLLDVNITLQLDSEEAPPPGPGEPGYVDPNAMNKVAPEYFNKNNPLNA